MIRTAAPFRIIQAKGVFMYVQRRWWEYRVREEGPIRSYMAAHLTAASFASHVARCVQKQLLQFDRQAAIHFDSSQDVFHLYGYTQGKLFSLLLTFAEVGEWKAAGPYALDRYIFCELEEKGISIVHMTPYLRSLFSQS
jgi:hypothetical protein